jgi:hypothetical protein
MARYSMVSKMVSQQDHHIDIPEARVAQRYIRYWGSREIYLGLYYHMDIPEPKLAYRHGWITHGKQDGITTRPSYLVLGQQVDVHHRQC